MAGRESGPKRRKQEPAREQGIPGGGRSSGGDLDEFMCCVREEIRALVGGHYYFIEVTEECTTLCRAPHHARDEIRHEVIDHLQHGISDEDLEHAVRMRKGHGFPPGYYEISDHIERKLRALLDA